MAAKNKDLNNLNLFMVKLPNQTKCYNLLKPYKWMLGVGTVFGMGRIFVDGDNIRPPSRISRLYSFVIICILLYTLYPRIAKLFYIHHEEALTENENWFVCIQEIVWCVIYVSIIVNTVYLNGKKTVILFQTFHDIDMELNITTDHEILKMDNSRCLACLVTFVISYIIISALWLVIGYINLNNIHFILLMFFCELELMIYSCLLASVQTRIQHVTGHLAHIFSLKLFENDYKRKPFSESLLWTYKVDPAKTPVYITLKNIYKLYEKNLKAFQLIQSLFNLQVLLFYIMNSINLLMSMFGFIKIIQFQKDTTEQWIANVGWWQRILSAIFTPCFLCGKLSNAVLELKMTIMSLLGESRHKEHQETAVDLLRYCDASELQFSVYGLFSMSVSLPFNFLHLVVTHVIVLLQLNIKIVDF